MGTSSLRRLAPLLVVIGLVAAACVGDVSDTTTTTAAPTTTTAAPTTTTSAGGGPTTTAAPTPVKIGAIHPLTGALAGAGNRMDEAIAMAVEEINTAGGIASLGGAPLEVLSADSTGKAEVGQAEAERLIGEGVSALVGTYQSSVTSNVAAIAEREGVPLVIDVAVADSILDQGYENVFRLQPNATAMGTFGARYLKEVADATGATVERVAYLHEESGFGTSVYDAFTAEAANLGIEVAAEIPYPAFEVTDLTTEMTQALAVDPDVIAVTGYYNDGLLAARAAVDLAADVMAIYGVAQGTYDTPQFVEDFGDRSEFFMDSNFHFNAADPKVTDVLQRFEERYGEPMDTAAMLAYQAVWVIADALERAGSADPAALRDAIAATDLAAHYMAYPGPIRFDDTGENVNAQPVLMQVIDGQVQQVWPDELQQTEPVFPAVSWR